MQIQLEQVLLPEIVVWWQQRLPTVLSLHVTRRCGSLLRLRRLFRSLGLRLLVRLYSRWASLPLSLLDVPVGLVAQAVLILLF